MATTILRRRPVHSARVQVRHSATAAVAAQALGHSAVCLVLVHASAMVSLGLGRRSNSTVEAAGVATLQAVQVIARRRLRVKASKSTRRARVEAMLPDGKALIPAARGDDDCWANQKEVFLPF